MVIATTAQVLVREKMVENTNIYYDNTKFPVNQRLIQVFDYLNVSKKIFADQLEVDKSNLSTVLNGKREMPAEWVYKLSKIHPWVNMDWFVSGQGEMLKLQNVSHILTQDHGALDANETHFSSNLSVLLQAREMTPANLAPLIGIELETLTSLVEGHRGPSLPLLVRLRKVFGVAIDTMLFDDLSQPGSMDNLHEKQTQQQHDELQKTLEAILRRLERLEEKEREREEKDVLEEERVDKKDK